MDSVEFLAAVRARHNIPSTRKLAAFLGIEQPRVTAVQRRRRRLDPDMCIAVAKALELPPEHVFAAVQAERAKRTEHRRIWERLARMAKHAGAAAVVGLIASTSTPTNSHAAGADAGSLYILSNRRRRSIPVDVDRRRRPRRRHKSARAAA